MSGPVNVAGAGWAIVLRSVALAFQVAEPGGHPADAVERAGVGPVAGRDQHAAAGSRKAPSAADLLGREPIDVRQHDRRFWPVRAAASSCLGRDDPGANLRRLVAGRGQGRAEEVGLAAEGLEARLAVDQQHRQGRRRPRSGMSDSSSPGRASSPPIEPDGQHVRAGGRERASGSDSGARPPGGIGPTTCAEPGDGAAVDQQLGRAGRAGRGRRCRRVVVTAIGRPGVTSVRETDERADRAVGHVGRIPGAEGDRPDPGRERAAGAGGRGPATSGPARRAARRRRWPSVRTITSRPGFSVRSRMRNASARRPAGRSTRARS